MGCPWPLPESLVWLACIWRVSGLPSIRLRASAFECTRGDVSLQPVPIVALKAVLVEGCIDKRDRRQINKVRAGQVFGMLCLSGCRPCAARFQSGRALSAECFFA